MKALILAAGEGTRLRPYTADRPKCLVEVAGRSLLDRQLDVLGAAGVAPVVVVGGYRAEMLPRPGIEVLLNPRYATTNMVTTLFCAEEVSVNPHRVDSVSAHPFKSLALRQRFEQSGLFDHFVVELRGAP